MIEFATGDLLDAEVQALVNTVNTVGIMGKGIALQFKKAYPDNFAAYAKACERGDVQVGRMFIHHLGQLPSANRRGQRKSGSPSGGPTRA